MMVIIQKSANKSDINQILLCSPKKFKFICGCERLKVPLKGLVIKEIPIPAAIGINAIKS
ncbi:hypothetical protein A2159_00195 [Candidatus Woesebacteria bacterium RBG_13_34_9]|uniref:Uncharacterized protein n=1 Tax=Candidatus Woesebacteria bacterium RBG_13_34_9 TaxID=1802477 RepID=A0A1F7X380_9BACT|nr:MAG: hypothetical protein A2159_00195 [Candidatus Woesebacteria bacterium RBG_13_34_9]